MNVFVWGSFTTSLTASAGSVSATVGAAGTLAIGNSINSTVFPKGSTIATIAGTAITVALPIRTVPGRLTVDQAGVYRLVDLYTTDWLLSAVVNGLGVTGATVLSVETAAVPAAGLRGTVRLTGGTITRAPLQSNLQQPYEFQVVAAAIAAGVDAAAVFTGAEVAMTAGTIQLERCFNGADWIPCNIGAGPLAQFDLRTPLSFSFGEPEKEMFYRLNVLSVTIPTDTTLNYRLSTTGQVATTLAIQTI